MQFDTAVELLQLYSIDENRNGPADFCTLVECAALFMVFPSTTLATTIFCGSCSAIRN